jgi:outer membrane protein OmpA-like peptidoglycan-associated protein
MANSLAFDVYFNMNSTTLDSKNKAIIRTQYRKLLTNLNSKSEVVVKVTGWVQPTKSSPNVRILSKGRAKSVVSYLQSLGLKAKYSLQSPGHQKLNIAKSRRASVEITWSTLK